MARCRAVPVIDIGPAPRWPGSGAGSPGAAILGAMFGSLNRYRWVVPVYLAAVAALGFGVWRYGWLQALDQLAARAESDLALASDRLSTQLQGYQEIAVIIADHPELARIDDPEAASRLLLDVADKIGATNVIFAGIDGVVLASAQTPAGGNVSAEPAFQRALQGAIGAQHGLRDGRRSRIVAAPAFAQDGKVRGALLVEVDLNKVEQAWRGDNPAVFFTDAGGEVLVTNRSELLFWRRPEGQAGLVPRDADAPPFGARREGRHEIWTVGWGPYLPETGLHLSRALPVVGMTAEVLVDVAPARRLASLQAAAVVAGCLAFGALLYLATERRRALASANRKLEARVAERTSDLSTANRQLRREVAERMEAEAALKKAQADLVQAGKLSALGQMSAGISHELNQPLMAIRSFAENGAEFLNRGRPEPAAENLSRISDMARRMGRIIRNLRAFARNEAEPVTRVDLVQVVTQAVELTEAQLRLCQLHRLRHHLDQVDTGDRLGLVPGEGAEVADDPPHPPSHVGDAREVLGRGLRAAAIEELRPVLGKGPDRHQRLVQLVADPGAHLPQGRQFASLHQIGLRLLQRRLRLHPLGHLAAKLAVRGAQIRGALGHPRLELAIGRGKRAAPFRREVEQRPEGETPRHHGRRLQAGQAPRRGDIDQHFRRHADNRQGAAQVQARFRQVGAPAHGPDLVSALAPGPEGRRVGVAGHQTRLAFGSAPEQKLGPVGDQHLTARIGEEDRRVVAPPGLLHLVEIDLDQQRTPHLAVLREGGRGDDPAPPPVPQPMLRADGALQSALEGGFRRHVSASRRLRRGQHHAVDAGENHVGRPDLVRHVQQQAGGRLGIVDPRQLGMIRDDHGDFLVALQLRAQSVAGQREVRLRPCRKLVQCLKPAIAPDAKPQRRHGGEVDRHDPSVSVETSKHGPKDSSPRRPCARAGPSRRRADVNDRDCAAARHRITPPEAAWSRP